MTLTTTRLFAAATICLSLVSITPAFAMTGRAAVGKCIDMGNKCGWSRLGDGTIVIIVEGAPDIICPSATAECTVVRSTSTPTAPKTGPARATVDLILK